MRLLLGHSGDSAIHRLDPRIKFFWLIGNLFLLVFFQHVALLCACLTISLVLTRLSGIALREFAPLMKIMAVIGIQLVVLQGLLQPEGPVVCEIGLLSVYLGGLLIGIKSVVLLFALTCFCLQFVLWTSPDSLTMLFVKMRLPHKYAILIGLSLRFLPVLERDLRTIFESQRSRGLELSGIWKLTKALPHVTVPLILRALNRSHEVALSMELRGYTLHRQRTFLNPPRFSHMDWVALTASVFYFAVFVSLDLIIPWSVTA